MRAFQIRLNDLIPAEPIVIFDPNNEALQQLMYDVVIDNYKYAYVCADNLEQFISDFKGYWNRSQGYYTALLKAQEELSKNFWQARLEEHDVTKEDTDTPELTDTDSWTFGRKDTTTYGRDLTISPDITESDTGTDTNTLKRTGTVGTERIQNTTQYNQQLQVGSTNDTVTNNTTDTNTLTHGLTHKRTGTEKHGTSGSDSVEQSGENTHSLNRTGKRIIVHTDKGNNKVTIYDTEKFYSVVKAGNLLNRWIDLFAPLFMDIIFADGGIF